MPLRRESSNLFLREGELEKVLECRVTGNPLYFKVFQVGEILDYQDYHSPDGSHSCSHVITCISCN